MTKSMATICIHGKKERKNVDNTGAVSFPIFQSATFVHPEFGKSTGFDYSRLQNPTREELERIVADLENGIDALAFSSGMSAIHALIDTLSPGDHIIATDDLYGGSTRLLMNIANKNGIKITFVATDKIENIKKELRENTKLIFLETPTNPMMQVTDIKSVVELAHKHNCIVAVDNTFLTPYFQRPLDLGADVVIHSGTKYLAGHNDTLAGFLVTNCKKCSEKFRYIIKTTGACLAPFDSWLVLRGIKTLHIRMEQHQKNAVEIVKWLNNQKAITNVYYPGLENNSALEISKKTKFRFRSYDFFPR